jgi:uncharacterized membrane protein
VSTIDDYAPLVTLLRILFLIMTFTRSDDRMSVVLINRIVGTALLVLSVAVIATVFAPYSARHLLLLGLIFLSRFLIEIIPIFMSFSAAGVAGLFGSWALKTGDANDILFFVFSIIICGCYVALFDFSLSFLGDSPYLSSSPFAFFSSATYRFQAVGTPIFLFLAMDGVDFGLWFRLVLVLLQIGFCSGLFLGYRRRPFISDWINNGDLAVCAYDVLLSASGLIAHVTTKTAGFPIFVLTFVLLPVLGVAAFFCGRFEITAEVWKEVTTLL